MSRSGRGLPAQSGGCKPGSRAASLPVLPRNQLGRGGACRDEDGVWSLWSLDSFSYLQVGELRSDRLWRRHFGTLLQDPIGGFTIGPGSPRLPAIDAFAFGAVHCSRGQPSHLLYDDSIIIDNLTVAVGGPATLM